MSVEFKDSTITSESILKKSFLLIKIIFAAIEAALSLADDSPLLAKTRNKVSCFNITG